MDEAEKTIDHGIHPFGRPMGLVLIVAYKAVWGLLEVAAGFLLIFSRGLVATELAEDPQDLFINWLLSHFKVDFGVAATAGAVFIGLGLVKMILAIGIWYRSWRFRLAALVFFAVIGLFGVYELSSKFTALRLAAVAADLLILYYLWKILPKHLGDRGLRK